MEDFYKKQEIISRYQFDIKDYKEALRLAYELLEEYPNLPQAYAEIASVYGSMGNYDKSIEYKTKAIELKPEKISLYYFSRARIYFYKGDFYNAIDDSLHVIDNEHLDFRGKCLSAIYLHVLILACLCTNQFDLAKEVFDKHMEDDYVYYTKPIKGRITKQRIYNCIEKKINILYDV